MYVVIALCTNCKYHGPRVLMVTQPARDTKGYEVNRESSSRCYQCSLISKNIATTDYKALVSYISTETPLNQNVHQRVQEACQQAYTEQALPVVHNTNQNQKEIPSSMLLGNESFGYCLIYKFRIFEPTSDFSYRNYSFLVVTKDLSHLTVNHDFYLARFGNLKEKMGNVKSPFFPPTQQDEGIQEELNLEEVVHQSFVQLLQTISYAQRETIIMGKVSENNMKMLELDTFTASLLHLNQNNLDTKQEALANLKFIAAQMNAQNQPGDFELLIHHLVSGGQVIVESLVSLSEQFILAISQLLPYGCCKIKPCATTYLEQYRTMFNIVCVFCNTRTPDGPNIMKIKITATGEYPISHFDKAILIVVSRPIHLDLDLIPTIAKRYITLLNEPIVTGRILELALTTTKDEWIQKAKLFYMLKINTTGNDKDDEIFSKIRGCFAKDREVVKFWTNALSDHFKQSIVCDQSQESISQRLVNIRLSDSQHF